MKRVLVIAALIVVVIVSLGAYAWLTDRGRKTTTPEFASLSGSIIDSALYFPADPAAIIKFSPDYQYVGGQKFILYGTADVEQHFFVETYPDGRLKSSFWLQFEGVRPGIEWQYDYSSSPLRTKIGDFDFYTNTEPGVRHPIVEYGIPGSDGYLARKFIGDKGYRIPKDFAFARKVHLPTDDRRKELLIIFMDDLAPTGFTGRELMPGGVHEDEWPAISDATLEKIKSVMMVTPLEQ